MGTTSILGFLVDLASGRIINAVSIENPQSGFGADVISRMDYAITNKTYELQKRVVKSINNLIFQLGNHTKEIRSIVIVDNSVMHHLFLGLPVIINATGKFFPGPSIKDFESTKSFVLVSAKKRDRAYNIVYPARCAGSHIGKSSLFLICGIQ